jgi:hypothetical protein
MKHAAMTTVLPAALLFALPTLAQRAPPRPPPSSQSQPAVATTTQDKQCGGGGSCFDNSTTDRDTSGPSVLGQGFASLAGSKQYVTRSGAQRDPWLVGHFDQCDGNRDGRITLAEYRKCHHASGGQP